MGVYIYIYTTIIFCLPGLRCLLLAFHSHRRCSPDQPASQACSTKTEEIPLLFLLLLHLTERAKLPMRLATGLAAIALLAGTASAKLSVQRVERHESAAGAVAVERRVANGSAPATPAAPNENSIFKKGSFTKIPQNETTCATRGEKQWAGTVDISDDKRLFYWWFDSRHDAENDPIVIFLNG